MASTPGRSTQVAATGKKVSAPAATVQTPTDTTPATQEVVEAPCPTTSSCAEINAMTSASASREHKVFTVSEKEDYEQLLKQVGKKLVLIEFYATWCGPCRLISAKLEELAMAYEDNAIVIKLDVDELEEIAIQYNVTSMPTFLFMRNKKKLVMFSGSNTDRVVQTFKKYLGDPPPKPAEVESTTEEREAESAPAPATPPVAKSPLARK